MCAGLFILQIINNVYFPQLINPTHAKLWYDPSKTKIHLPKNLKADFGRGALSTLRIVFADNFPPKIVKTSNVINATLYEIVQLNITAVDNDTITFRAINKPAGATVNQSGNVLYFVWNVTSSQKVCCIYC